MANNTFDLDNLTSDPTFNFLEKITHDDTESPYFINNFSCEYMSLNDFNNLYRGNPNITIMSINIQSLPSKFADLYDFIMLMLNNNSNPDIICIQETWQIPCPAAFSLPGYSNIAFKTRSNNVQGGGVGIFV